MSLPSPLDAASGGLGREVSLAFEDGGPLSSEPGFAVRQQQLGMALAVAGAIESRAPLVVEAGTGVGKTWAYLAPILLSGRRALISTATKSLQDQLFLRDLPRLRSRLATSVTTALLKGRSSYLCVHRMEQARLVTQRVDRVTSQALAELERWSQVTRSGDLAEVEGLDERSALVGLVTSTRDNCLGGECPRWGDCHLVRARREAMAADLVVVNHHLFFADLALRDTGVAELLPTVDVAVFDEAHQLLEAGLAFLGQTLAGGQLSDLGRDVLCVAQQQARGLAPWTSLASELELAARDLRIVASGLEAPVRFPEAGSADESARSGVAATAGSARLAWDTERHGVTLHPGLERMAAALGRLQEALEPVAPLSADLAKLVERAVELRARADGFTQPAPADQVRWIDIGPSSVRLVQSPLDIRRALTEQRRSGAKAWIFTSATLGDDERLSWFTGTTGLEDAHVLRVGSPFDYPRHARLWLSAGFPSPQDPQHPSFVGRLAADCAQALQGRTFVLTTTLRALRPVARALREALAQPASDQALDGGQESAAPAAWQILVQGESPRRVLLERFADGERRVLVASQSFWEGIDVPGAALQCVVIDKLPFPPPNDPLVQARQRRIEAEGGRAFEQLFVAEAAVSLKQGAGRLIRTERDRGLLVVCDPRLVRMGYGRRLRAALPPMTPVASKEEALEFLRSLGTRA